MQAGVEDVRQQSGFLHIPGKADRRRNTQVFFSDPEDRVRKPLAVQPGAGGPDRGKVDPLGVCTGKEADVRHDAQAEAAVEKVLAGVEQQKAEVLRRRQGPDGHILDPDRFRHVR